MSGLTTLSRDRLFMAADAVVLIVLNALAAITVAVVHEHAGTGVLAFVVAMALGMAVPMAIGRGVACLLGSIETMVPVMVSGIVTGVLACLWATMAGTTVAATGWLGAATGGVAVGALLLYRRRCVARLIPEGGPRA